MANYKSSQYIPSFLRAASSGDGRMYVMNFSDVMNSDIENENSFAFDNSGGGLKSTQQLNVDWSKFENHTFFMSAEAKVNLAFEQIINGFPFDGTKKEVDEFFSSLTGFDKWVFDQFPKYRGQLHFSGSQLSETTADKGTYIVVKDMQGTLFPVLSPDASAKTSVLNPKNGKSLSIEMQLYVPTIPTDGTQIVLQKINVTTNEGFSIRLNPTISTSEVEIQFDVISGSSSITALATIVKGKFNHLCFILDRTNTLGAAKLYVNESLKFSSQNKVNFDDMKIDYADLVIGSGSQYSIFSTIVTPQQTLSGVMDELRIFHDVRSESQQISYAKKSIQASEELKLYYKFNEPAPPLSPNLNDLVNTIVLDSSGNSLHTYITNFIDKNRQDATKDAYSNMLYEKLSLSPVLFPANQDVIALNEMLLVSGSEYDSVNPNLISKLIPRHYLLEGAYSEGLSSASENVGTSYGGAGIPGQGQLSNVQLLLSLLYIWAKFFDEIRLHLDAFSKLRTVDYDLTESTPNNFLIDVFKSYGIFLPPLFNNSTVEQYLEGENIDPILKSNEELSLKSVQHEMLRRILVNLPAVIKSKGTLYSIKTFLRAIGIDPDSSMRFREYGGPNYRILEKSRDLKSDVTAMVDFTTASLVVTPYLSASRTEVGYPTISGVFVKDPEHGAFDISNNIDDGLLTSGSWTIEACVKYNLVSNPLTSTTQSIFRLCTTGSAQAGSPGLTANLVAYYDKISPYVQLFLRPGTGPSAPTLLMSMSLPKDSIFDGDIWNFSFGCRRNDSFGSAVSSSYYMRAGTQSDGELRSFFTTSSYFQEFVTGVNSNVYRTSSPVYNALGSYITLGSAQTIAASSAGTYNFLNNTLAVPNNSARATNFDGRIAKLRFWSKHFDDAEWIEHIKNYQSLGVSVPYKNYNYEKKLSGSFERLRLDTLTKQEEKSSNNLGNITFIDFSENNMHARGTGFDPQKNCVVPEIIRYSHLSPYFDEVLSSEKVRVRGYTLDEYLDQNPWASRSPVYEIVRSESPLDDVRFSIDFSLADSLNKDIVNMFSSFEELNNILGKPELQFSTDYPDLDKLRTVYFNRLKEKLNFKAFFEFYSWFDNSISVFIEQLLPKKTVYKGTNFMIESHMLERHKHEYFYSESYVKLAKVSNLSIYSNE